MAKPIHTASALNILKQLINCPAVQPPKHEVTKKRMDSIYYISEDDSNLLNDFIMNHGTEFE